MAFRKMKKFSYDIILNLFSSLIVTLSLQAILYPSISQKNDSTFFGELILIMGIISIISSTIGATGVAVFFKNFNKNDGIEEDTLLFRNVLGKLYITIVLSLLLLNIVFLFSQNYQNEFSILLINIIIIFMTLRIYLLAWFRASLKYKSLFISNIFLAIGYFFSFALLVLDIKINTLYMFILPELIFLFSFIIIEKKLSLFIPSFMLNQSKKLSSISFIILLLSSLLVTLFKYIDRITINLFLTPDLIAVFYAGNITGQLFAIPFSILSTVIFSYYIQSDKLSYKNTTYLLLGLPIIAIAIYLIGLKTGPYILKYLYSEYYFDSVEIFYIVNIGHSLIIIDYILRGFIIKFFSEINKLILDFIPIPLFITLSIIFVVEHGLVGIAWSFTVSVAIKCLVSYLYLFIYIHCNYSKK